MPSGFFNYECLPQQIKTNKYRNKLYNSLKEIFPVIRPVCKGVKILLEKTSVSVASDRSSVICQKKQSRERS